MYKEKITELLLSTNREGMDKLVEHMENGGFFMETLSVFQAMQDILHSG